MNDGNDDADSAAATRRAASLTQQVIRAVSGGPVLSLLAPHGYKRRVPHFWREADGLRQAVNFQASQWGTRDDGQFTVNLGVSSPVLYSAYTGRPFPRNPGTALWPISLRIGHLTPTRCDLWWKVTRHTNVEELGTKVTAVLRDYALPYLERIKTVERFHSLLLSDQAIPGVMPAQRPLIAAILAAHLGNTEAARRMLGAALDEHRGKPFESTIRTLAERLQIQLDGVSAKRLKT